MELCDTVRVHLRNFCQQDLDDMFEFCSQPEIETVGWKAHKSVDVTKKVLEQWILNENIFAVVYKNENNTDF